MGALLSPGMAITVYYEAANAVTELFVGLNEILTMTTYNLGRKQSKQRLQNRYLTEGVCTIMLTNMFVNGLLYRSMHQVMNSTLPTYNQSDYVVKSDIIAVAVIGIIVISGAAFALMCRYK